MEILQQILIWFFEALAIGFLILAVVSLFLFGSSLFWVSDKANQKAHLYLLFATLSFVLLFIATYPNLIVQAILCILPISVSLVGFLYFRSKLGRELFSRFTQKTGIDYPFNDKKQQK